MFLTSLLIEQAITPRKMSVVGTGFGMPAMVIVIKRALRDRSTPSALPRFHQGERCRKNQDSDLHG